MLTRKKVLLPGLAILLLGGGVWAVVGRSNGQPAVPTELTKEALRKQVEAGGPGEVFERAREAMSRPDITDEQRHQVWENVHEVMESQMNKRLDEYFTAAEAQRVAILDRHLDEMLPRMREMERRRAERERAGEPAGPGPSGGEARGAPQGPGGGQRPDARPTPTREQRKARSESRSPDQMARRMAYFTAMRQRAEQRGIQLPRFGGGPGGPR